MNALATETVDQIIIYMLSYHLINPVTDCIRIDTRRQQTFNTAIDHGYTTIPSIVLTTQPNISDLSQIYDDNIRNFWYLFTKEYKSMW